MQKRSTPQARKKPTITTTHKFDVGRYGCSMIGLGGLDATAYTLFQIVVDVSASTTAYQGQLESLLKELIKSWSCIERKHNVLLRVVEMLGSFRTGHPLRWEGCIGFRIGLG